MDTVIGKIYWQQSPFGFMDICNVSTHRNHLIMILKHFYCSIELIPFDESNVRTFKSSPENALQFDLNMYTNMIVMLRHFFHLPFAIIFSNFFTPDVIVVFILN